MRSLIFIIFSMCLFGTRAEYPSSISCGDIIEIDGTKAIVFNTDATGKHGKAMSINTLRGVDNPWCNNKKVAKNLPSTLNESDGFENTSKIVRYAKENNCLENFPAYKWCTELGNGWYIPSLKELEEFVNFWLGNNEVLDWDEELESEQTIDPTKQFYKEINNKLLEAGGTPFINGVYTSTTNSKGQVYVFSYDRAKNVWSFKQKGNDKLGQDCVCRAFIKF